MADTKTNLAMKGDIKSASETFARDRETIGNSLYNNLAGLNGLNYGNSSDSVTANLNANLNAEKDKLNKIKMTVDEILAKTEELYNNLNKALDDLEKLNQMYEQLLADEPQIHSSQENSEGAEWARALWESQKAAMEAQLSALNTQIDAYKNQLDQLNIQGIDSLDDLNNINSTIDVTPYKPLDEDKLKALNYREALYNECNKLLDGKTTLDKLAEMLNYTKEEMFDALAKYSYRWYRTFNEIPDNIEKIMGFNRTKYTGDASKYHVRRDFKKDEFDIYSTLLKIGGKDFEFAQFIEKDRRDFKYDLDHLITEATFINEIANYPQGFFDEITQKKQTIAMVDSIIILNDATGTGYNRGIKLTDSLVYVVGRDERTLSHELSHVYDELASSGKNKHYSVDNKDVLSQIFVKEYDTFRSIDSGITYDLNLDNIKENFCEGGSTYINHTDEMRDFAPESYNFYHAIYGDRLEEPRTIEGELRKPQFTFEGDNVKGAGSTQQSETKTKTTQTNSDTSELYEDKVITIPTANGRYESRVVKVKVTNSGQQNGSDVTKPKARKTNYTFGVDESSVQTSSSNQSVNDTQPNQPATEVTTTETTNNLQTSTAESTQTGTNNQSSTTVKPETETVIEMKNITIGTPYGGTKTISVPVKVTRPKKQEVSDVPNQVGEETKADTAQPILKDPNQNNSEKKVLRTEFDDKLGVVKIYYSDGTVVTHVISEYNKRYGWRNR